MHARRQPPYGPATFLVLATIFAACTCLVARPISAQALPTADPQTVGMRADLAEHVQRAVTEQIEQGKLPGCVVTIGRRGHIVHHQAYGHRQLKPDREPMTTDTVFDLASLTKPIATSTSVMQLVERGDLRLQDKVSEYFPEFAQHDKRGITIEHLLVHSSGLIPDNPIDDFRNGWDEAFERICDLRLISPPGERFKYSDVGFILLAAVVEEVTGQSVDTYAAENVFGPLGMQETTFNPPTELAARAATTEQVDGEWLRGTVHDPRARLLGGVAGHAGLFSTASDLAIYAQAVLDGGVRGGQRVLSPQAIREWTTARDVQGNRRGLGWDMGSVYSRNRGETMTDRAFGHGGFTGTAMWIDPELELFVIFLSNRVHPDGKGEVNNLAGRIGTIASAACVGDTPTDISSSPARAPTTLAIDVLAEQDYDALAGKRVGLIANHTSRNAAGASTVTLFADDEAVNLVALFSPEHGFYGTADQPNIENTVDQATRLPVYSLYGETRKPTAEQLEKIDVLVFDIQDIGCRFYTYISTMALAMEAAAEHDKEFVVLDRPNPIGGHLVEGPVLDEGSESFVGCHTIPVRHGMTIGELATMLRSELELELDLKVVEVENWSREQYLYDTGLPWINTSPNMRSLTEAVLYPGVGLFETTNVSVGRGTDTPFEVLGAPWLDGRKLARSIRSCAVPGLEVVPIRFTPSTSKHEGVECEGVNFVVTDWQTFRPLDLAWAIGASLVEHFPDDWDPERFPRLLGSRRTYELLLDGASPSVIEASYQEELQQFMKRRETYLIY